MTERQGFIARLKRFWQGLTGSGVQTYGDEPLPGAHDSTNVQANAELQPRQNLRGHGAP